MTRVAAYSRVSSQEQAKEGVSLPEQRERLQLWAKLEGWEIVEHYSDEGVAGGTDIRPELQRLMADAKMRRFDLVAVTKIDRFMRNTRLLLNYIHELEELGIGFAAQAEGIDTRKAGIGKIILALLGAVAEWERDRIGERIKDARSHLASRGRWSSGRTPFGYRFNKEVKELEICEPEAEVVRYIFNTYINKSLGIIRLAERLNAEQKLTPRWGRRKHNLWTQSAVRYVLTHSAYKGGQSEDWQFKCPAIVEPTLWYLAQRRLMTNRHFKPAKSNAEFQGLLRCGLCGHTLRISYDHNTKRKYECPGRSKKLHLDGSQRCLLPRFDAEELEASLSRQIVAIFSDRKILRHHLSETLKGLEQERKQLKRQLKPMQAEMERVKEDMTIADTKLEMRRVDPETYKAIIAGLQAKLRNLERQQREADPTLLRQFKLNEATINFYRKLMDSGENLDVARGIMVALIESFPNSPARPEAARAILYSPREAMTKYGFVGIVYPDHIQLKGTLPLPEQIGDVNRQSNISPGYRLNHYPQSL